MHVGERMSGWGREGGKCSVYICMCFALDKTNGNAGKWTARPFVRRQVPEVGNNVIEVALPKPRQCETEKA